MSDKEFRIDQYLEDVRTKIINGKRGFLNYSKDKDSDIILIDNSLECIGVVNQSLASRLYSYNENPHWVSFLVGWEPKFDNVDSFRKDFLKLSAIMQIIVEEVRALGVTSSVMRVVYNNVEENDSLVDDEDRKYFFNCIKAYERFEKSAVLFWRLENKFEEINEESISGKFGEVENEVKELESSLKNNLKSLKERSLK